MVKRGGAKRSFQEDPCEEIGISAKRLKVRRWGWRAGREMERNLSLQKISA